MTTPEHEKGETKWEEQFEGEFKQGYFALLILITWLVPPLWPVAIALTWGIYPKTCKYVSIAGASLVVIFIVSAVSKNSTSKTPLHQPESSSSSIKLDKAPLPVWATPELACRKYVQSSLKSPNSFRRLSQSKGKNSNYPSDWWLVDISYSAKNSFNARLTKNLNALSMKNMS